MTNHKDKFAWQDGDIQYVGSANHGVDLIADAHEGQVAHHASIRAWVCAAGHFHVRTKAQGGEWTEERFDAAYAPEWIKEQCRDEAGRFASCGGAAKANIGTTADGRQIAFVPHENAHDDETVVMVDPKKFDAAWSRSDPDFYIPPGGGGAEIKGRRENFTAFLNKGKPVQATRVGMDVKGDPSIIDGRHRFSVLRDLGTDRVGLTVPKVEASHFTAQYG